MFDLLARIVQRGESFHITYTRHAEESVTLIVQPKLNGETTDTNDNSATQARAALQRPRIWKGTHAEVTDAFDRFVAATADDRAILAEAHGRLTADEQKNGAMKAAAANAAQAVENKTSKADTKGAAEAGTASQAETDAETKPQAAPSAPASNPASLFD